MGEVVQMKSMEVISASDVEVLKNSKFKGFTDAEVKYATSVCAHLQLNPLLNQIHFVKRGNVITTQVGIDGFRLAAERTGKYAGSDEPIYEGPAERPTKATITVYKLLDGQRCPFTASARWAEYYPGDSLGTMWRKMPFNQLAKCAEALALRKAFPAELGSLRTDEEMVQADSAPQSKAAALNARATVVDTSESEQEVVVPQETTVVQEEEIPDCCGKPMSISQYKYQEFGDAYPFWCRQCRKKIARKA